MDKMSPYLKDIANASASALPWEKFTGKNILIAGATGLIGTCLVRILMARQVIDFNVYALCRNGRRATNKFSDFINLDCFHIIEHDVTEPLHSDINFDFIIDSASSASPSLYGSNPVSVIRDNIYGVDNLLSYGINHNMERFLYVSSGEIYGDGTEEPFSEINSGYVNSMSPRSCYPSSKRAAETLACSYAAQFGANIVVARPCHVYGPEFNENDNRVYAEFLRNAVTNHDIILKSPGTQYRSWCYVVDCAIALLYVLFKGKGSEAYNVTDAESNITIRELAEMAASLSNSKIIFKTPSEVEKASFNPILKATFSDTKLKALGWSPRNDMKTSFEHCFMHLKTPHNE